MNYSFLNVLINIIITAIAYLLIPFILFFNSKKEYDNKWKRKILIFNSIFIAIIFIIIRTILNDKRPIRTFAPALLYYYINETIWLRKEKKEKLQYNKKSTKKHDKKNLIIINITIISIVIILILVFSLIKKNKKIEEQKLNIEKITSENIIYEQKNKDLLNKTTFFNENIVFEIEELKGNYISYNCMKYITNDNEYLFLAYNTEQAKAKGLKEYKCPIRIELGLKD